MSTTKQSGDYAEELALRYLQSQGFKLIERNYRLARGPRVQGGEIDLIMQAACGTLVFVEVRMRRQLAYGGAAASISRIKQGRILRTASHYLQRYCSPPACRFDVVCFEQGQLRWIPSAFTQDLFE